MLSDNYNYKLSIMFLLRFIWRAKNKKNQFIAKIVMAWSVQNALMLFLEHMGLISKDMTEKDIETQSLIDKLNIVF